MTFRLGQFILSPSNPCSDHHLSPALVPITFFIRNLSSTHNVRIVLRLVGPDTHTSADSERPLPMVSGRMTHRQELDPSQVTKTVVKICVDRPGSYSLSGWGIEIEVLEPESSPDGRPTSERVAKRQVRYCYVERPHPEDSTFITVVQQ